MAMEMENNELSSNDYDLEDEMLSAEDDPLFEVPPEKGNERRLRARRISMKLREESSEDEQQQEHIRNDTITKVKDLSAKMQKQQFKNETERVERRRLMARQRSQRARDRKRAMSITFTNASNLIHIEEYSDDLIKLENPNLEGTTIKTEVMTPDDLIQMLDPLQCVNTDLTAAAIKEEPCDLDSAVQNATAVDPLNSAAKTVEKQKIEGHATNEESACVRKAKVEQTKRIAGVLNNYNEIDDEEDYMKRVPRDQIERMRLYHARRKAKESITKHLSPQLHASPRKPTESVSLSRKESTKSRLDLVEDCATSLDELKRMLGGDGIEGNDDDDDESSSCDSIEVEKLASIRKRSAMRQRERRARETQAETEARLLRQRISQMKLRLYTQIMSTEEEIKANRERKCMEMRLKRQRRREVETPEQAAARKKRESRIYAESRNRIKAIETPEETAARRAFSRERNRKRYEEIKANETPEQRTARKERERQYRENHKRRKLQKSQTEQSFNASNSSGSSNCKNSSSAGAVIL